MAPDKCPDHSELMASVARIDERTANMQHQMIMLVDTVHDNQTKFEKHLEGSERRMIDLDRNTQFRCSSTKYIFGTWMAIVGLSLKTWWPT